MLSENVPCEDALHSRTKGAIYYAWELHNSLQCAAVQPMGELALSRSSLVQSAQFTGLFNFATSVF